MGVDRADTATVLASVRESVHGLDPLLPVSNVRVLEDVLERRGPPVPAAT